MSLIKSISGIRGTIGGAVGDNLTPLDTVKFAAAYGTWIKARNKDSKEITVVVGRDARISGAMISHLVTNTLIGLGIHVIDLGLSTTPTVEVAVPLETAQGGIILTASHNPKEWNALKLLNERGEFLNAADGLEILDFAAKDAYTFAEIDQLGTYKEDDSYIEKHIDEVLNLELVDIEAIKSGEFKVVLDAVNSTGGIFIPALLERLGVTCVKLYCEPNGHFPHNPEPLKQHLGDISALVVKEKADFGIVVDPDVDRLAIVNEDGSMFGEEYTLVACADYILGALGGGHTVSNLSSSRALRDITEKHGGTYTASAVGEVNVVSAMKTTNSVIGGEGNGGIIYPASHYGRDSLVGVALFLSHLAKTKKTCKELRDSYPQYYMSKNKIQLTPTLDVDAILEKMAQKHKEEEVNTIDGVKVDFAQEWLHLRKSNTEPIIRIYTESRTQAAADALALKAIDDIKNIAGL
ncbi:MAG: phosphoglucosamine mutase [Wenyingzhuangia sp.]|uniref:phosphoglucosamine mutase n=1 Tax=Wenyingzhuangia sp. TaxID=1964193 RepID=UPI00321B700E